MTGWLRRQVDRGLDLHLVTQGVTTRKSAISFTNRWLSTKKAYIIINHTIYTYQKIEYFCSERNALWMMSKLCILKLVSNNQAGHATSPSKDVHTLCCEANEQGRRRRTRVIDGSPRRRGRSGVVEHARRTWLGRHACEVTHICMEVTHMHDMEV